MYVCDWPAATAWVDARFFFRFRLRPPLWVHASPRRVYSSYSPRRNRSARSTSALLPTKRKDREGKRGRGVSVQFSTEETDSFGSRTNEERRALVDVFHQNVEDVGLAVGPSPARLFRDQRQWPVSNEEGGEGGGVTGEKK